MPVTQKNITNSQRQLAKQINVVYSNFINRPTDRKTRGLAQAEVQRLEEYYNSFQANHKQLLEYSKVDFNDEYFTSNFLQDVEDYYYENKGRFNDYLEEYNTSHNRSLNNSSQGFSQVIHRKLPPLHPPEFSGSPTEWETFRDLFIAIIHGNDSVPVIDKFYYLKQSVKDGKAKEIMDKHKLSEADYVLAWKELTDYYENKRRLVNFHLSTLFNVKPMKGETSSCLEKLRKEIEKPVEALKLLGRPTKSWDDIIVFQTVNRFEENTAKDWQKYLGDSTNPPTKLQLDEFIKAQILYLEAIESSKNVSLNKPHSTPKKSSTHSHQVTNQGKNKNKGITCPCCSKDHSLINCNNFKDLEQTTNNRERSTFVRENKICPICLGKHFDKCKLKRNCKHCKNSFHHSLLHYGTKASPSAEKSSCTVNINDRECVKLAIQSNLSELEKSSTYPINDPNVSSLKPSQDVQIASTSFDSTHNCDISSTRGILLATAIIKVQAENGLELKIRALIDQGSQVSFISSSLCQRLKLAPRNITAPIKGTGGVSITTVTKSTRAIIKPRFSSSFAYKVDFLVLPKITSYKPPSMKAPLELPHLDGLILADPQFMDSGHIDMLLGASVYARIIEEAIIKGRDGEPIAQKSALGWLLSGEIPGDGQLINSSLTSLHVCQIDHLDELLQKFWEQEDIPKISLLTNDEKLCEDHFVRTHNRDSDGRYVLKLPFKDENNLKNIDLKQSYQSAQRMLFHIEKRFDADFKLKEMYHKFLHEYEDLGHMVRVPLASSFIVSNNVYFIPHHGIWKERSTSTKLRTVFNGSSRLKTGCSLNDLLHVGANLLPILADLIMSWRNYKYVFVADIEKMYRQINIHPDHRQYQCILWRFDSSEPIQTYKLGTVTYGLASSPFQAIRTLQQLAIDHITEHPLGAEVLHSETYMDDIISGGNSVEEAFGKQQDTTALLKKGCFPLRKYLTNNLDILMDVPPDYLAFNPKTLGNPDADAAVLGVHWKSSEDSFYFQISEFEMVEPLTKRIVLSRIAKLFDPLGWIAPVIIKAKILMQLLWQEKRGWDDEISPENSEIWNKWESELSHINLLKIPRYTGFNPQAEYIELHGFADASKLAYGAVLYLRTVFNDKVIVTLLTAKSKVASLKLLSIPRLELSAAHLLAKLAKHYLKSPKVYITASHLWSDSTDVLQWLKSHPSRWKPFVANRCAHIHEDMPKASWHHVKTKDNPADVISRGCTAAELVKNELYWQGPKFLLDPGPISIANQEPQNMPLPPPEENATKIVVHLTNLPKYKFEIVHKFSSLMKLLRVTSYCLRFIVRCIECVVRFRKSRKSPSSETFLLEFPFMKLDQDDLVKAISPVELARSRDFLVFLHQELHFSDLKMTLEKGTALKSNQLMKLNPFLENGFIKVGGRLANAQLPHDNKYPLLLHHSDAFTRLLVRQSHLDTFHGGIQLTLGTLRLQYWIIKGRSVVKSRINACHKCRLYSKKGCSQLMGNLPTARTAMSKPFAVAGVDYAGPIKVRPSKLKGNITQKGYIAIFVCFSTRAIHIEVVEDYSSAAFVAAFHRFTSRRGQCSHLHSDKGTTFIGADSMLRQMFQGALQWSDSVKAQLSNLGTQWHFNPPGAPHFGGLWESGVKSMKHHLYRMIGEQVFSFIELSTLLCRIEAILNSRPLLPLSDDVSDLNPLTPAHFLIQRPSFLVPEPDFREAKIPLGKRYELLTQASQHFWDRWSKEYLTSLQVRNKWTKTDRSLQPGDIVRIKDEISPPGQWPLGIVVDTHPGKDGLVRAVTVRTSHSEFKRPVVKLILIEPSSKSANVKL